jgi:hypothetical protein
MRRRTRDLFTGLGEMTGSGLPWAALKRDTKSSEAGRTPEVIDDSGRARLMLKMRNKVMVGPQWSDERGDCWASLILALARPSGVPNIPQPSHPASQPLVDDARLHGRATRLNR